MSFRNYSFGFFLLLCGVLLSVAAKPQSFDCTKSSTSVFCNDSAVADLDLRVANEINKLLAEHADRKAAILSTERQWLRDRDAHCQGYADDLPKMNDCLIGEYSERLDAMRSGDRMGNPPVSYSGPVLSCDHGGIAVIRPLAAIGSDEQRCRLADGENILVRWGKEDPFDLQSQEQYATRMSVWVNGAKWVDREIIDDSSGGAETYVPPSYLTVPYRIRISGEGMSKCYVEVYGPKANSTTSPPTRCSMSARSTLQTAQDKIEFRPDGTERPKAGTIRLTENHKTNLCSLALKTARNDTLFFSHDGVVSAEELAAPQQLDETGYGDRVLRFDIDNSGRTSLVIKHSESTHAAIYDRYFVYTKERFDHLITIRDPLRARDALLARLSTKESQDFADARINGKAHLDFDRDSKLTAGEQRQVLQLLEYWISRDPPYLAANAEAVYPDIWEVCVDPTGNSHPPGRSMPCGVDEEMLVPFRMINADQKTLRFRAQYMSMEPFLFEGATHFRLSTADENASNVTFIVKPSPRGQAQLICSVEVVRLYL